MYKLGFDRLTVLLALVLLAPLLAQAQNWYPVPDPFKEQLAPEESFYKISAFQGITSSTASDQEKSVQKDEYFSLEYGLSFVRVGQRTKGVSSAPYALISDSPNGRSYYVRNPYAKSTDIDCELDHLHHQRNVFPWVYEYPAKQNSDKQNANKKRRRSRNPNNSIYGLGAIWLNAIKQDLKSDIVGDRSTSVDANVWIMKANDLEVWLNFEKPHVSDKDMEKAIANSKLHSIRLTRMNAVGPHGEFSGSVLDVRQNEYVSIQEFVSGMGTDSGDIKNFFRLLAACRRHTKEHRIFPSLMREISLSPERMYQMTYEVKRYARWFIGREQPGEMSKALCRPVRARELVYEWFSMKRESHMMSYRNVEEEDERIDRFVRKFTAYEGEELSSRFRTAHYHIIESGAKEPLCITGEREDLQEINSMFCHSIYFSRPQGKTIYGILTGLGPLLLNVAEVAHKEFSIERKKITRVSTASSSEEVNFSDKTTYTVDEWRVKQGTKVISLYFHATDEHYDNHGIADLLRVEIRDTLADLSDDELAQAPQGEGDLVVRYDLFHVEFETSEKIIDYQFNIEDFCKNHATAEEDPQDPSSFKDREPSFWEDIFGISDNNNNDQEIVEDFELDPHNMLEDYQFPDFFEYLNLRQGYFISSMIRRDAKFVYVEEMFDMNREINSVSIYFNRVRSDSEAPDLFFFVNFNQEVIFRVDHENKCKKVDDYDNWMRLLAFHLHYNRMTEYELANCDPITGSCPVDAIEGSERLRLFGVGSMWRAAAESANTNFKHRERDSSAPKIASWSFNDDDDDDMEFEFKFDINKDYYMESKAKSLQIDTKDLLKLSSIDVKPSSDLLVPTDSFLPISINIVKIDWEPDLKTLSLPEVCRQPAVDAASTIRPVDAYIPSFIESVKHDSVYSVHYRMKDSKGISTIFEEWFDLDKKRGVISFNSAGIDRMIYLDGKLKIMAHYLKQTDQCQRISELGDVFEFKSNLKLMAPKEEENSSYFGFASLWLRLQSIKDPMVYIHNSYDLYGRPKETRIVKARSTWLENDLKKSYAIKAEFRKKNSDRRDKSFRLNFLTVSQLSFGDILQGSSKISTASVSVDDFRTYPSELEASPAVWNPPAACRDFLGSSSSLDGERKGDAIPSLHDLLKSNPRFLMRAVVRDISSKSGDLRNSFIIEERIYNEDVRYKTEGLSNNLDLLLYPKKDELFDLSVPYTCKSKIPDRFKPPVDFGHSKLIKFWADDTTTVDEPYHVYYGPVSLWRLAEKSPDRVKLITSFDFGSDAPASELENGTVDDYLQVLERDMRTEIWQMTSEDGKWSYKMYFEQHVSGKQVWHTLERIELVYNEVQINIEVINYRYDLSTQDLIDQFHIPEGYGCRRKNVVIGEHQLEFNRNRPHMLEYEASIQYAKKVRGNGQVEYVSGSSITGIYAATGDWYSVEKNINLIVYQTKTRANDLKFKSDVRVIDRSSNIMHQIDRLTSKCQAKTRPVVDYWTIEFETPKILDLDRVSKLYISEDVIRTLFTSSPTSEYHITNAYVQKGMVNIVHEKSIPSIFLVSGFPVGRVNVVRAFRFYQNGIRKEKDKVTYHNQMELKIMMFDDDDVSPSLIINMVLNSIPETSLSDVLSLADVSTCYNRGDRLDRGSRKFSIDYKADQSSVEEKDSSAIAEDFIEGLVSLTKISALQFAGSPEVEYSPEDQVLTVYFELLEAPTAIEYFNAINEGMHPLLEEEGDIRVLKSLEDCSNWCDETGCIAMAYCSDRTCRVLPLSNFRRLQELAVADKKDSHFLEKFVIETSCSYYYSNADKLKPRLDSTVDILDRSINGQAYSGETSSIPLLLKLATVWPTKFVEVDDESRYLLEESANLPQRRDTIDTYYTYMSDHVIDTDKLSQFATTNKVKFDISHAKSTAQCLEQCATNKCFVSSYCKYKDDTCVTVSGQLNHIEMRKFIEPSQNGCSVSVSNALNDYQRFDDTAKPERYQVEVDVSLPIECAILCSRTTTRRDDGTSFRCLSFDFCFLSEKDPKRSYSKCYLQSAHLLTGEFDRAIMLPHWDRIDGTREPQDKEQSKKSQTKVERCDHYSRSILGDYRKLPNRKLKATMMVRYEGVYADKCAVDCQDNAQCVAFEYCYNEGRQPPQSCYFVTNGDLKGLKAEDEANLERSDACSVYILEHLKEQFQFEDDHGALAITVIDEAKKMIEEHGHKIWKVSSVFLIVMGSIILATAIQFVYIRLFGRAILFRT